MVAGLPQLREMVVLLLLAVAVVEVLQVQPQLLQDQKVQSNAL